MYRPVIRLLFPLLLFFCVSLPAFAQHASISGEVTDPHNAVVTNAEVQVINLETGDKINVKTGKNGSYHVQFLAAGRYKVVVHAPGFSLAGSADITLSNGQAVVHNVQLTVGVATTSIIVRDRHDSIPNANLEVAVGPLIGRSLLDIPYSITVMPAALIENVEATLPITLYNMTPTMKAYSTPYVGASFTIRGFQVGSSTSGETIDGMRYEFLPLPTLGLEDKERFEVLSGLSSYLYGTGNIGGSINYVRKRPTANRFVSVVLGDYENKSGYFHADLGGPIDKHNKFGYRLNIAGQDGNTAVQYQSRQRSIISGALDWHATSNLLVQLNASNSYINYDGVNAGWSFATNSAGAQVISMPKPPAAEKLWSQKYTNSPTIDTEGGARVQWGLNRAVNIRAAYNISFPWQGSRIFSLNTVTATTPGGTYNETLYKQHAAKYRQSAMYAYIDTRFKTGSVQHMLTTGYFGDKVIGWNQSGLASVTITNMSFVKPIYIAKPAALLVPLAHTLMHRASVTNDNNLVVGDDLLISKSWSALAGVTVANVVANSYNSATGAVTVSNGMPQLYNKWKATPSASLIFRPIPSVSTYFTYMEGLEQGTIVPATGSIVYTNAGQVLPPYIDNEYEIGARAVVRRALLTASLFQIDKALQYAVVNSGGTTVTETYVQSGRERHNGVEFTVTGKVTKDLTLFSGATFFGAKIRNNASTPALNGKTPANVAEQLVKAYAEYWIPRSKGLTVSGGVYYTGQMFADTKNVIIIPAVTVEDVGLRYESQWKIPMVLRLNVTNVTNKSYWIANNWVGNPRSISFSTEFRFHK